MLKANPLTAKPLRDAPGLRRISKIDYAPHMKRIAKPLRAKKLSEALQLEEYAGRKGMSVELAEKWLAPNLEG